MSLQVYKQKTVLVKRTGEKITVDIPYDVVNQAMATDALKIWECHSIRTKAINERYGYNVTDDLEVRVDENYKELSNEIMAVVRKRRKDGERVNKEIVANIAEGLTSP